MSNFVRTLVGALVLGAVVVVLYRWNSPAYAWRQKLTVEIETPAGAIAGSAVTEVRWGRNLFHVEGAPYVLEIVGDAIAVEIGKGRYLFGLHRKPGDYTYLGTLVPSLLTGRMHYDALSAPVLKTIEKREGAAAALLPVPPSLAPVLATFADVNDPQSVREVEPGELSAVFGEGVSLRSISIEVTDEPVTDGKVASILTWLPPMRSSRFFDGRFDPERSPLLNNIGKEYFAFVRRND